MTYTTEFFNVAVQAEINSLPAGINASFTRIAEKMVESGQNLGLPHTRPFGDGLFKMRAKGREGIGRAFFCALVGQRIVILHGFFNKTQQTQGSLPAGGV